MHSLHGGIHIFEPARFSREKSPLKIRRFLNLTLFIRNNKLEINELRSDKFQIQKMFLWFFPFFQLRNNSNESEKSVANLKNDLVQQLHSNYVTTRKFVAKFKDSFRFFEEEEISRIRKIVGIYWHDADCGEEGGGEERGGGEGAR